MVRSRAGLGRLVCGARSDKRHRPQRRLAGVSCVHHCARMHAGLLLRLRRGPGALCLILARCTYRCRHDLEIGEKAPELVHAGGWVGCVNR